MREVAGEYRPASNGAYKEDNLAGEDEDGGHIDPVEGRVASGLQLCKYTLGDRVIGAHGCSVCIARCSVGLCFGEILVPAHFF